ncbi:pectate lyase family protein [Pedobacter insulae]|uniref:Right handed beta helix region n=1 Tax=Pedobacter insulae TaxID=414048 RepID=A0A1I2TF45_9SPHI|nr:hypothetical protein [Pedobacter insulae]SFG62699.1 hypothetical protein SAMN04489864_101328 [Pedobacter insulae]
MKKLILLVFPFFFMTTFGQVKREITEVQTIDALRTIAASKGDVAMVIDTLRGGMFIYDPTINVYDNGLKFPAKNNTGGWKRQRNVDDEVHVRWYGAKFDNRTDDAASIQAAINSGFIVKFPNASKALIKSPLIINRDNIRIFGNNITLTYTGEGYAIKMVPKKNFLINLYIESVSVRVRAENAKGFLVQCSRSRLQNCRVTLEGNGQVGFELAGDKNGTGSYHNSFDNCFVQGYRHNGKVKTTGWLFTHDATFPSRGPNANKWVGGRVGQCEVGMYIQGGGNVITGMTAEGCGTGFIFENKDSKNGCNGNQVIAPYLEITHRPFLFSVNSRQSYVSKPIITGQKIKELNFTNGNKIDY